MYLNPSVDTDRGGELETWGKTEENKEHGSESLMSVTDNHLDS